MKYMPESLLNDLQFVISLQFFLQFEFNDRSINFYFKFVNCGCKKELPPQSPSEDEDCEGRVECEEEIFGFSMWPISINYVFLVALSIIVFFSDILVENLTHLQNDDCGYFMWHDVVYEINSNAKMEDTTVKLTEKKILYRNCSWKGRHLKTSC